MTYLIYSSAKNTLPVTYYLPKKAVCIAVLSVFAVVFVTMMYSMSKIKKDDPVETLKNENI